MMPRITIMAVNGGTAMPKRRVPSRAMADFLSRLRQSARAVFLSSSANIICVAVEEAGRFSSPKVCFHFSKSQIHEFAVLDLSRRIPNHQRIARVITMGRSAMRMRRRGTSESRIISLSKFNASYSMLKRWRLGKFLKSRLVGEGRNLQTLPTSCVQVACLPDSLYIWLAGKAARGGQAAGRFRKYVVLMHSKSYDVGNFEIQMTVCDPLGKMVW